MNNQEYRDRVALWLHDNAGNLLVQDDRDKGLGLKFPGGGIDPGQSVNDAAIREALEEVGYALAEKPRAIPGVRARKIDWDPIFSAEAAAKGRNYLGSKHYHRIASAGEPDESLLGSEGDALKANWMPIEEVLEATRSAAANPDNKYNYFDEERLNAAEKVYEMLNHKTASYGSPYMNAYLIGKTLAEKNAYSKESGYGGYSKKTTKKTTKKKTKKVADITKEAGDCGCGCGDCADAQDLTNALLEYSIKTSGVKKKYQAKDGGLNRKGRAHFKRTEGANLKRPVSKKQAKKSPKSAKRRKSFCARMGGMKKKHNINCSKTPDKSICKALRKWDC